MEYVKQKNEEAEAQKEDFKHTDDTMAFAMAIHTVLMVCSFVLLLACLTSAFPTTLFGTVLVVLHLILLENVLKGQKKFSFKLVAPWIIIVALEELALLAMAITHLDTTVKTSQDFVTFLKNSVGFIIVHGISTGTVLTQGKALLY